MQSLQVTARFVSGITDTGGTTEVVLSLCFITNAPVVESEIVVGKGLLLDPAEVLPGEGVVASDEGSGGGIEIGDQVLAEVLCRNVELLTIAPPVATVSVALRHSVDLS